ncbi:MAG: PIG-L family deacetylase [Chitinophagaceae bacterium]
MTFGIKRMGLLSRALRLTERDLEHFGKTVIIAPHPDDESLGCGGLVSMLRRLGLNVECIFVSDGSMSHPSSVEFSAERRAEVRRQEALNALAELNVSAGHGVFLDFPDGAVPNSASAAFEDSAKTLANHLLQMKPDTIFIPYQHDPHRDHEAVWQLAQRSLTEVKKCPRIFEYPVWLWELGREEDYPSDSDMTCWRLDIGTELETKRKAIAAHRSQLGQVFFDDPAGFVLRPDLLAHFEHPFEIFFETK